jgi:CRISPR-associated protein Cmr2
VRGVLTVSDPHCFDRHLENASGNPDQQKRELGNTLLAAAKATSKEWGQELARFFPTVSDLDGSLDGSWLLMMTFTLAQPFTSKTESAFHPYEERQVRGNTEWFEVQNPLVRDHLTGLPLVKPTTWKGHLRFAAGMASIPEMVIHRLFGETLGNEGGRAGRLHFFPTFFNADARREVVTPLKRSTRTPARGPLDIEVVPRGSTGTFCLLYLPHPMGPKWSLGQIADDLEAVAAALKAMFLDYGFSAKKTAGWGVVEDAVSDGSLSARGAMWPVFNQGVGKIGGPPFRSPEDAFLPLMDEAGMPKPILRKPDGTWLSNSEFNALAEKPSSLNVYRRFRSWYEEHGSGWRRSLAAPEGASAVPVRTYPVESVTALSDLATRLARAIRAEGANG